MMKDGPWGKAKEAQKERKAESIFSPTKPDIIKDK